MILFFGLWRVLIYFWIKWNVSTNKIIEHRQEVKTCLMLLSGIKTFGRRVQTECKPFSWRAAPLGVWEEERKYEQHSGGPLPTGQTSNCCPEHPRSLLWASVGKLIKLKQKWKKQLTGWMVNRKCAPVHHPACQGMTPCEWDRVGASCCLLTDWRSAAVDTPQMWRPHHFPDNFK